MALAYLETVHGIVCFAAYANGIRQDRIERALEDDYFSHDPSASKRAAYIREDHGEGQAMGRAIASLLPPLVILPSSF